MSDRRYPMRAANLPRPGVLALMTGLLAAGLYLATTSPHVTWGGGDSPKLAVWVHDLHLGYTSLHHPLYIMLAHGFSRLPIPAALPAQLNLFSGLCAAITVMLVVRVVQRLTGSLAGGIAAGAALAVSHTFWTLAVITEVYTLHTLIMMASCLAALAWIQDHDRKAYVLAWLLAGLGCANHLLMAFVIPALAFWSWRYRATVGRWWWLQAAGWWAIGTLPITHLWWMDVRMANDATYAWEAVRQALGMAEPAGRFLRPSISQLQQYALYWHYQFPILGTILAWVGCLMLYQTHRTIWWGMMLATGGYIFVSTSYAVADVYQFAVSSYIWGSIWIGIGVASVAANVRRRALWSAVLVGSLVLAPVSLYHVAPHLVGKLASTISEARTLPYRDNSQYFLHPSKRHDDGALQYARELFGAVEPDAVIVGDFTPMMVLSYFQDVEEWRPDVALHMASWTIDGQLQIIEEYMHDRPVYAATLESSSSVSSDFYLHPQALSQFEIRTEGNVHRILQRPAEDLDNAEVSTVDTMS